MTNRPSTLPSKTVKVPTKYGQLYITVAEREGNPTEVYCTVGKSGASTMAKAEAVGRLSSLALRSGATIDQVVNQLINIDGGGDTVWRGQQIKSIPDAVGKVLKELYLKGD